MPPSADSWLRDSWQVLHEGLGGSFWHVLFVRWCSSSEGGAYAEESCSDGLARHPAGTAKTLGRRWWCTLNRHLVRSRFSETVSIPPPVSVKYAWLYGKLVLNELRISKKYAYASPPSFLIPEQLNLDKYRFGMLQVFLFKTSSL